MARKSEPKVSAFIVRGTRVDGRSVKFGDVVEVPRTVFGDLVAAGKALDPAEAERRYGKAKAKGKGPAGGKGKDGGKAGSDGTGDGDDAGGDGAATGDGAGNGDGFGADPDKAEG